MAVYIEMAKEGSIEKSEKAIALLFGESTFHNPTSADDDGIADRP